MMIPKEVVGLFVYGTLKRGQCREHCWPASPRKIVFAWTRGHLYTGPEYPALVAGDDKVLGELWFYDTSKLAGVVEVLDEVEQTNQPGLDDLYHRVVVEIFTPDEERLSLGNAFTYHYAINPSADGFHKMQSRGHQYVQWPESSATKTH